MRIAISTGPELRTALRARVNSSSRVSGHSPMNFVVMCSFSTGIQCSFANGRSRSINAASAALTSEGMSIAVKSRKTH